MESSINLTSLREISETQLEALLRFDSPPETPAQSENGRIECSRNSTQQGFFKSELEANLNNSIIFHNHDQMDSQIQYSVFHNCASNTQSLLPSSNMQNDENDFAIIAAPLMDTVKSPELTRQNNTNDLDDIFAELTENVNFSGIKLCNSFEEYGEEEAFKATKCSSSKQYKHIENNLNLEEPRRNKWSSNSLRPKCPTQLELRPGLNNSCDKQRILSCPAQPEKHQLSANSYRHTKELYTMSIFSENELNRTGLNNDELSDSTASNRNNESVLHRKLSADKNLNDSIMDVGDFLEKSGTEYLSGGLSFSEKPCQKKLETSSQVTSEETLSNDKSQYDNTLSNAKNIQMLVDVSSIPIAVRQLHDVVKTNYSDFAFVYALSSQLCQERVPMECFVSLKIALLLSLVSIGNNENRAPIPIIAITNDTYMTDYLMSNIGQLATRFLGPVIETKSLSSVNYIEADPILLARGGVYYAGDWTRLKSKRAEAIFKNLECSNVAVEKSTLSFPLETAIWTYWRSFKYGAKDQQTFNKFLKIFGLPVFVSDDNHEVLIDYTLEQSSVRVFESTVDHLSINEDDMRNFLTYISQHNVDLSPEATLLLRNYFVASRSIKQDCLSQQSYTVLKQFAESFAKLSMRKVVLYDDALAAIIMFEHFIENICSSPENAAPHFGNFTFVGAVNEYLKDFTKWLNSYIENFV